MTQLVFYIYLLSSYLIVNRFFCRILRPRDQIKHPMAACYIFELAFCIPWILAFGLYVNAASSLFVNILLLFTSLLLFQGRLVLRLCAFFISCFVLTLGELFGGSIFIIISRFGLAKDTTPKEVILQGQLMYVIFIFALDILFLVFVLEKLGCLLENRFMHLSPSLLWKLGVPLSVLMFTQTWLYAIPTVKDYALHSILNWGIVLACLLVLNSALKKLEHQEKDNIRLQEEKALISQRIDYYHKMTREYDAIHKWNHDISNHLLALSYLVEQKQSTEACQYIDTLLRMDETEEGAK